MDGGYILLVGISFGLLLIISQRVVPKRKRLFRGFVVTMMLFLMCRYQYQLENIMGYVLALFISYLFWLLLGRYNPVKADDEIKVYGLND